MRQTHLIILLLATSALMSGSPVKAQQLTDFTGVEGPTESISDVLNAYLRGRYAWLGTSPAIALCGSTKRVVLDAAPPFAALVVEGVISSVDSVCNPRSARPRGGVPTLVLTGLRVTTDSASVHLYSELGPCAFVTERGDVRLFFPEWQLVGITKVSKGTHGCAIIGIDSPKH